MTQIDGLSLPVRLPPVDAEAFDAVNRYAADNSLTISAAASEMLRSFAPPVERGSRPPAPEDGREGSGEPPASPPSVLSASNVGHMQDPYDAPPLTLEESKALHPSSRPAEMAPLYRPPAGVPVHVHLDGDGCVYGDRCGR